VRRSWSFIDFIASRELPVMADAMPEPSDRVVTITRGLLIGRVRGELHTYGGRQAGQRPDHRESIAAASTSTRTGCPSTRGVQNRGHCVGRAAITAEACQSLGPARSASPTTGSSQ
jgi:hypothetical protein